MKIVKKSGLVFITGILLILLTVSCSGGTTTITNTVPPTDYQSVKNQLEAAKTQIDLLQKSLAESQSQASLYDDMKSSYLDLQKQYDQKAGEYQSLKTQYDALLQAAGSGEQVQELTNQLAACSEQLADLQSKYDVLKAEHDLMEQQAGEVTEANIKNALWTAINDERTASGLPALLPGANIALVAHKVCLDMVKLKQLIYDNVYAAPYMEVSLATGYCSVADIVNATFAIWKSEALRFELNILADKAIYGAVAVVLDSDIFYITFVGSNYP